MRVVLAFVLAFAIAATCAFAQVYPIPSGSKVSPRPEDDLSTLYLNAVSGDAESALILAIRYQTGNRDMQPEPAQAVRWFLKAAELGHPFGAMQLQLAYYLGRGVTRNPVEVRKWGIIAAALARDDSERKITTVKTDVLGKEMQLTDEQRVDAEKQAKEWLESLNKRRKQKSTRP